MNHADAPPWIRAAGLTEHDVYLFREGSHRRLYEKLGARVARIDGTTGVSFAVWAPNAAAVSMIGDFNGWDKTAHPVQSRADESGDWATLCCRSWRRRRCMEMLKNSLREIFPLAAARYMPALRSINQGLMPLIDAGASCPGRKR